MSGSPHLLLAISGHGFGHLAQCAPVVNQLARQLHGLRLTVMSALPETVLGQHIDAEYTCIHTETDPLLRMRSAWDVDVPATAAAFRAYHRESPARLAALCLQLRTLRPDLVLANIPWLLLTAAAQEEIPAVALSSLNWAAIYSNYLGTAPDSREILAPIRSGYQAASIFLAPMPALPMPELPNYRAIGTIARLGIDRHALLRERLGVTASMRMVLVGLGGIASTLPLANWPQLDDVVWLFPQAPDLPREDMIDCSMPGMSLIDILASADAVLTKPGYGTYTEAVCNGVPLLTLARPDWPETAYLNTWAREQGCLREISVEQFRSGSFAGDLADLFLLPGKTPPLPTGIGQAVELLGASLPGQARAGA